MSVNYGLTYQHRIKRHILSLEFTGNHRNPDRGGVTNAFKVAAIWTYNFNKKIERRRTVKTISIEEEEVKGIDVNIFSYIQPGQPIKEAISLLERLKAGEYVRFGDALIYETRVFEEIESRQRLVIIENEGKVKEVDVIFDTTGNTNDMLKELARINELIMKRYGSPTSFYEKGKPSSRLAQDLKNGIFARIYEWSLPGGILRLGIPARLDEIVRIEIHFAREFPPYNYSFWSLENIP